MASEKVQIGPLTVEEIDKLPYCSVVKLVVARLARAQWRLAAVANMTCSVETAVTAIREAERLYGYCRSLETMLKTTTIPPSVVGDDLLDFLRDD